MRRFRAAFVGCAVAMSAVTAASQLPPPPPPTGNDSAIVVLPTMTPTGELPSAVHLHSPDPTDGLLLQRARELDLLLRDTAQDLGFTVALSDKYGQAPANGSERALLEHSTAYNEWVVAPRIEYEGTQIVLRLVVAPPNANHVLSRTESMAAKAFQVRAVVMLRDLLRAGQVQPPATTSQPVDGPPLHTSKKLRSEGRAVLATHTAMFGGYVGYSLQKSSGSDDARLTYLLMAIGTGVGLGGSLIIAEEWDVGLGDAWYMSAGVLWPTLGGTLLAHGHDVQPESDRYAWGIAGGFAGVTLASVSLSFAGIATGGAAAAHSGGFIGAGLGAGTEMAIRGETDETPYLGLGYGALGGILLGGLVGRGVEQSPSRILMMDVGVGLGALSFAAVGSPLLIADNTEGRERAFVLLTMSGALAGGATAYLITGNSDFLAANDLPMRGQPLAGVIGQSMRDDGSVVPAYGVGWSGLF